MAKNLKLTGVKTYVIAPLGSEPVKKGEVVRFPDDMADKVLQGHRLNAEREEVPYWTLVADDAKVDYDITDPEKEQKKPDVVVAGKIMSRVSQRQKPASRGAVVKRAAA